jgi:hypothetical protein
MNERGASQEPSLPQWARISIDLELAGATLMKLAGHLQALGDDLPNAIQRADARTKLADAAEALAALERLAARRQPAVEGAIVLVNDDAGPLPEVSRASHSSS